MARTAYTYQLKSVECDQCGGPVVTEHGAIEAQCGYCHATLRLVARPKESTHDAIDEVARMAGLRAQVGKQDPNGPLSSRAPAGMQAFAAMLTQRDARPAAVAALRQEWAQARAEATNQPSRQSGTRAYQAAYLLARFYDADHDDARARAVVETALPLVAEAGQRDILRLWLARAALDAGDLEAYDAWLADTNPQPVHLEVDTALRLTRARRALHDNDPDAVLRIIGQYPSEVPISVESAVSSRFVRAHAFMARGDAVSARREMRGALAGVTNAVETVRVLLAEYPGPADVIAEEEAKRPREAAIAAAVTAPAAAAAYEVSGRRVKRAVKRTGIFAGLIGCLSFAPMLLFFVPMVAPSLFLQSCGMGEPEEEIIRAIQACPGAVASLGEDVAPAPGWSCGEMETGGGSGYANWSFAVSGSEGRGTVAFTATETGGNWYLQSAQLEGDEGTIDLLGCAAAASNPPAPGGGALPGVPAHVMEQLAPGGFPGIDPAMLDTATAVLATQCESGDPSACHSLATMYRSVPGMLDAAKARDYTERACAAGHSDACDMLGH